MAEDFINALSLGDPYAKTLFDVSKGLGIPFSGQYGFAQALFLYTMLSPSNIINASAFLTSSLWNTSTYVGIDRGRTPSSSFRKLYRDRGIDKNKLSIQKLNLSAMNSMGEIKLFTKSTNNVFKCFESETT
tara:strand:- start:898 stop:1290 length:393 start_codon:yes stop_codon:yes gene_type:complete